MKRLCLILTTIVFISSCSSEVDLNKLEHTRLDFKDLPEDLQEIYSTKFKQSNDSIIYYVITLDENFTMEHYHTGMHNQLLTKGFNHHFIINDKEFKLQANQGDPFVLKNKKLFYTTELNLAEYNFEKADYIMIDLEHYLKE